LLDRDNQYWRIRFVAGTTRLAGQAGGAAMMINRGMLEQGGDHWQERMRFIVETMREMSLQSDPQEMVRAYYTRVRDVMPADRFVALSRRDMEPPRYRITRSSLWTDPINPWTEKERLPVLEGGLLGELIYGNEPRLIDNLQVSRTDPAYEYLAGPRSLIAVPQYDKGVAMNMVVLLRNEPTAFDRELFPEWVWLSNLFGRATHNLVLAGELRQALAVVERELRVVADIQRSLLPRTMPTIPGLSLAAHYQTSHWAGGDYYDFFELPDGRWGILIADVSGHGTPAAVLMAILHSLAHSLPGPPDPPEKLLAYVNERLTTRYTSDGQAFVTAFYGIFDPVRRELTYASAGHNPPRLKRCEDGSVMALDVVGNLPLGVFEGQEYQRATLALRPGDQIVFYTDGITEAQNAAGTMFGPERLDDALANCYLDAQGLINTVLEALNAFTEGLAPSDDRTVVVAKVL
jgi:sigma-B regulation protein RsbU (phosphoserine phosphatase)